MPAVYTPFTWEDFYNFVCGTGGAGGLLSGVQIDQTLFTNLLNAARMMREGERPWRVLVKQDTSQVWTPGDTWQTPKQIAPSGDFREWIENNALQLWDGSPNPGSLIEPVQVLPFDQRQFYNSSSYAAFIDYANEQFYMAGNTSQTLIIIQSYIADFGDILPENTNAQPSYTWQKFPARYDKILGFDVAARYRLGTYYDDLQARNADDNNQSAESIMEQMRKWDGRLARVNLRNLDYAPPGTDNFFNHRININN